MCSPIDEQVRWWIAQGETAVTAHEALYGNAPLVMTWPRLRERMWRDFGHKRKRPDFDEWAA